MVKIEYNCDVENCTGKMISTGIMLTSYPAKYPHVCNICGVEVTFNRKYPGNEYRDKKE